MDDPALITATRRLALLESGLSSEAWTELFLPRLTNERDELATSVLDDDRLTPVEREARRNRYRALNDFLAGLDNEIETHCKVLHRAGKLDPRFHHRVPHEDTAKATQPHRMVPEGLTGLNLFTGDPAQIGAKLFDDIKARLEAAQQEPPKS